MYRVLHSWVVDLKHQMSFVARNVPDWAPCDLLRKGPIKTSQEKGKGGYYKFTEWLHWNIKIPEEQPVLWNRSAFFFTSAFIVNTSGTRPTKGHSNSRGHVTFLASSLPPIISSLSCFSSNYWKRIRAQLYVSVQGTRYTCLSGQ